MIGLRTSCVAKKLNLPGCMIVLQQRIRGHEYQLAYVGRGALNLVVY